MGEILVTAGEPSGDMHAARVVNRIKEIAPETKFAGMGSTALENEGVNILIDPTSVSTVGFGEAFKNLKVHLSHIRLLKEYIRNNRPDIIFLVDYSGFSMMMARIAYKMDIPAVNYFPPTAWIWGKWRARWMARYQAKIAAVFPMEKKVYEQAGARVDFVGHPLVDIAQTEKSSEEIYRLLELDPEQRVILLMPGSRRNEVENLLPEMLTAAERMQKENAQYQFVLSVAPGMEKQKLSNEASKYQLVLKMVEDSPYELMKIADLMIGASGTATLEAMLMGTPMIIVYQTSWSTYQLGKRLINIDYIGLPNIIADRELVPELIQDDASSDKIYQEATHLLKRGYLLEDMERQLNNYKQNLGGPGAIDRTARLVLQEGGLI